MKLLKILSILLALAISGTAWAQEAKAAPAATPAPAATKPAVKKMTVAVSKIKTLPAVLESLRKNNAEESFERIAQSMPDSIGSYIHATRKLEVIPPSADIDLCVNVIEESQGTLVGLDQEIVAKFRSVKRPISITINDYQDLRHKTELRGNKVEARVIRFGCSVKFIDSATGALVESKEISVKRQFVATTGIEWDTEGGSKTNELFSLTAKDLCQKIAFSIVEFLAPSKIIGISKKGILSIDKGKDTDVKKGQVYEIFEVGEEMFDPETGESLGVEETSIGKAEITACRPKFSNAKVISRDPDYEIAVGNIVRLAEEEDEEEGD